MDDEDNSDSKEVQADEVKDLRSAAETTMSTGCISVVAAVVVAIVEPFDDLYSFGYECKRKPRRALPISKWQIEFQKPIRSY